MADGGPPSDPPAWDTIESTTVYTCPGFDVVRDEVRLPDGTETGFHYVHEGPSVVVLPFTTDGDVVVIAEWRQAVDGVSLGLPAGGLEDDEGVRTAARRELEEETGYEPAVLERLAAYEPANGLLDSAFHFVVASECEPTGERDLDHNESITVGTVAFDTLRDRALGGDLRDGRSALAVLRYALQRRD